MMSRSLLSSLSSLLTLLSLLLLAPGSESAGKTVTGFNLSNPATELDLQNGNVLRVPLFVYLWGGLYAALYAGAVMGRKKRSVDDNDNVFAIMDEMVQQIDLTEALENFDEINKIERYDNNGEEDNNENIDIVKLFQIMSSFVHKFGLNDLINNVQKEYEDEFSADYDNDFEQRESYVQNDFNEDNDDEKDCLDRFVCEMATGKIVSRQQLQLAKPYMDSLHVSLIDERLSSSPLLSVLSPSSLSACRAKYSDCAYKGQDLIERMAPKLPHSFYKH